MDKEIEEMIQESIKQAKAVGKVMKPPEPLTPSSLHEVLGRNPDNARFFMFQLDYISKHGNI